MRSGRIRRWAGKAQGCMRPIVRFRSGLRPSLQHTMEVKTQNQISHDSWYKERGHSMAGRRFSVLMLIIIIKTFTTLK